MKKESWKIMDTKLSRRSFITKSALALGTVAVYDLTGIVSTKRGNALKALASEGLKENDMPHVCVKLWPGRSEQTKQRLSDAIVRDIVDIIGCGEESVSVAIEEIDPQDWKEKVYDPLLRRQMDTIYKKPGYSM
jgi:4-oxalocrotonate tautomerase